MLLIGIEKKSDIELARKHGIELHWNCDLSWHVRFVFTEMSDEEALQKLDELGIKYEVWRKSRPDSQEPSCQPSGRYGLSR